jgi:methylenetetrahydrofolate reductase (NADPH)
VDELAPLSPGFVSVTYGAGGSTRERTIELVSGIKKRTGIETVAHLTCVGHTRDELGAILDRLVEAGVENVLALRGDPPRGQTDFKPVPGGFRYASELVAFIRERKYPLCVGVAGYPEGHIENPSREKDLAFLKAKIDAGADFIITQLFLDNAFYFDFVERARKVGIAVPIVPGIMPFINFDQLQRMVRLCGSTIPMQLLLQLEKVKDNPEAVMQLGIAHATIQCAELLGRQVPGIHFYTLNRSPATRMIVSALRSGRAG